MVRSIAIGLAVALAGWRTVDAARANRDTLAAWHLLAAHGCALRAPLLFACTEADLGATPRLASPGANPHAAFLEMIAAFAADANDVAIDRGRDLDRRGFRRALVAPVLGAALSRAGAGEEANAVWARGSARLSEILFERADRVPVRRMAVVAAPESSQAWFSLGEALRASNAFDEARACFERALALDRPLDAQQSNALTEDARYSPANAAYRLGEIAFATGDLQTARRFLLEAVKQEPDHFWAPFLLALVDRALTGNINAAVHAIERIVKLHPNHVAGRINLGYLNEQAGNPAQAEEWFASAVRIAPLNDLARAELQRIRSTRPRAR